MDGRKGHVWKMRQGLPQGVVLSPRAKELKLNVQTVRSVSSSMILVMKWVPTISFLGSNLAFNKTPLFLGVMFDRTLSFDSQVDAIQKKVGKKCNLLAVLVSREWGWKKEYLKGVFN